MIEEAIAELPDIDPGETVLAVVGTKSVITREVEKMTADDRARLYRLRREIVLGARSCVTERLKIPSSTPVNYKRFAEDISRPFNAQQAEDMVRSVPSEMVAPFMLAAARAFETLQGDFPASLYTTYASTTNLQPAAPAWFRFRGQLDVATEPLSVFALINRGGILKSQVDVMRRVFPTLSRAVDFALRFATDHQTAEKKSFQLRADTEFGVTVWSGKPVVVAPFQTSYENAQQQQAAAQKKSKSTGADSITAKESLSGAQATTYGTDLGG